MADIGKPWKKALCLFAGKRIISGADATYSRFFEPTATPMTQKELPGAMGADPTDVELVRLLYRQSNAVLAANFVIPLPVIAILRDSVPMAVLLVWCGAIYVLTALRIVHSIHFFRQRGPIVPARWARSFMVMSWLSALMWGLVGSSWLLPEQPPLVAFACVVLAGMSGGAVPSLSAHRPTAIGTIVAMLAPFALYCFVHDGTVYRIYLLFTLCLLAVNLYYSRNTHRTLRESVRLRFENLALIGELKHERDRATEADLAKTRFLAAASHDLRQPVYALGLLTATLAGLARRTDVPAAQAAHIAGRLDGTLDKIGTMLDGLLDASRLDAGLMPVRRQPLWLGAWLVEMGDEYAQLAREQGGQLRVHGADVWIDTDPALLHRIIDNLLSNALRYAPGARVLVGCRRRTGAVEIQVIDQGPGIPEAEQARIFDEFTQLPDARRPDGQGLGLGLAIVRRLAALLGHRVAVRSIPGRGTMFAVTVPLAAAMPTRRPDVVAGGVVSDDVIAMSAATQAQAQAIGIVLIDDDAGIRSALGGLLALWGHPVYAGATVDDVLAAHAAAAADAQAPIGLILADYRLGNGVTGIDAVAALRRTLGTDAPAVLVTGDTAPDRLRALHASGLRVLHKPIAAERLRELIAEVGGMADRRPSAERALA